MSDSCAGACCSVFPLDQDAVGKLMTNPRLITDGPYIADMLIPLTRRQALRRSRRLGYPDPPRYSKRHRLFTCRHWNEKTRLCGDYAHRPLMCSAYPYGSACERGCGYSNAKADAADAAAEEDMIRWDWDEAVRGWRLTVKSTARYVWDEVELIARPRES